MFNKKKSLLMSYHLANQSWDLKKDLTKDDADNEVAVRGRLLGLIELQQEPGELIRHVTSNNAVFSKKRRLLVVILRGRRKSR